MATLEFKMAGQSAVSGALAVGRFWCVGFAAHCAEFAAFCAEFAASCDDFGVFCAGALLVCAVAACALSAASGPREESGEGRPGHAQQAPAREAARADELGRVARLAAREAAAAVKDDVYQAMGDLYEEIEAVQDSLQLCAYLVAKTGRVLHRPEPGSKCRVVKAAREAGEGPPSGFHLLMVPKKTDTWLRQSAKIAVFCKDCEKEHNAAAAGPAPSGRAVSARPAPPEAAARPAPAAAGVVDARGAARTP